MQKRKWLSMLLALLASVSLWIYIVTVENPEEERTFSNIPVVFVGEDILREDHELLITDVNVPTGISLTFYGRLSDLTELAENRDQLVLNIDVSNLRNPREYPFSFDISNVSLPSGISSNDLILQSSYPAQVIMNVENLKKKTVPVKVLTDVEIVEGYVADRLVQNYSEIVVEGPEDAVNEVGYAQAVLKRENVDKTITSILTYELISESGDLIQNREITSDVKEIEVTLPVLMYKDVPLVVPLIDGGGATGADAVVDIDPQTIRLSADPTVLEGIQNITLSAIDLGSMMTNTEEFKKMITTPDGCINLSGDQEAIISVQIKNKAIRQIRVSSNHFSIIGYPDEMEAKAKTKVLPITIRASEKDIDQIVQDNIRIVVDLSAVNFSEAPVTVTVPVKVYVDGFEGVGIVGNAEYSIAVDISPVAEEPDETAEDEATTEQ